VKRSFWFALACIAGLFGLAAAAPVQNFTAQCQEFFKVKDYPSAKGQCTLATTNDPQDAKAWQILAASTLAMGELDGASQALEKAKALAPREDETLLVASELAFAQTNYDLALSESEGVRVNSNRKLLVRARSLDALERPEEAIEAYRTVIQYDPKNDLARVALAERLLQTDPTEALAIVQQGTSDNPVLLTERGYLQWASGKIPEAIKTLELALEQINKNSRAVGNDVRIKALSSLAMANYGIGEMGKGGLVLNQLNGIDNVLGKFLALLTPYLLPILLLLLLHLFGESRIEPLSTLEFDEGQRPWTVAGVYRILIIGLSGALVLTMVHGSMVYGNLLSMWTPLQNTVSLPIFYGLFALIVFALSWQNTRSLGWRPREVLFPAFNPESLSLAVGAGVAWTLATVGYAYLTRNLGAPWNGYYLPIIQPSPWLALPLVLLPLTEPFWRSYAFVTLEKRYDRPIAIGVVVCLYALVFALPLPLMVLECGILMLLSLYKNSNSSVPAVVMRIALSMGLLIIAFAWPAARAWF
jgi:tetratricopeptide (TPR) repeat protein